MGELEINEREKKEGKKQWWRVLEEKPLVSSHGMEMNEYLLQYSVNGTYHHHISN